MQALGNLSGLQKDAIEKSYIHFGLAADFLEHIAGKLTEPGDRLLATVNRDAALMCRNRLAAAFPFLQ